MLEGVPEERIRVCYPGIDVERFAAAREPSPPADGTHLVLSIGRLVWEKGHQDLLRAMALLREHGRTDVRALIVGVGPEESRLRRVVRDLELEDVVEFRGWIPYEEIVRGVRARILPRARLDAHAVLGGAVRDGAGRGDVGARADRGRGVRRDPRGGGRVRHALRRPATGWASPARSTRARCRSPPGTRRPPEPERLERYSLPAAAARLRDIYDELMGDAPRDGDRSGEA